MSATPHDTGVVLTIPVDDQLSDPTSPTADTGASSESQTNEKSHMFNEQTCYVSVKKIITIFLACASVDLLALIDQTTLAASLYIVANALKANSQASWIASGYFITSTSFQLLYGRLTDIWSRKVILLIGLAIFFFGSLASSLAQNATQLIIFRAITGVGGGGLMTVAQFIVSDVVPLRERGKYQGILGSVVALANGIGPIVGGVLSSQSDDSWRWIFRLNMPLTVLTTLCVIFFMPLKKVEGDWFSKVKAIDFVGAVLALSGTAILVLGLTWGGADYPWSSSHVIGTIVVGTVTCVGFLFWQWKGTKYPLVSLHIFNSRIVNGACLTMAINGWNFLVQVYYIPLFYQLAYGYSPVRAAALLLPITLVQTASSTLSGLVVHWMSRYRESILFGWACWAIGLGMFSTLDKTSNLGKQIGFAVLTGIGVGNTLQPALIAVQAGVRRRDMAIVTSFRNFVRNLGGTIGLAVSGAILNNIILGSLKNANIDSTDQGMIIKHPQDYLASLSSTDADHIRAVLLPAYQRAFRVIFVVCASLAALAFVLAFFLMPQINLTREDDDEFREKQDTKA